MTVLFVDNLQWADPSLRDHLGVIVRSLSDLPFLLVTAQRPDGDLGWPPPVERPLVLQVPLGPLNDRGVDRARVRHLRATPAQGPTTRTRRHARRSRWRQPAVPRRAGHACRRRCGNELPGSLRALIAARIDQLPAPQRAIVDNAAVLGTADSIGALVRFAEAMGQDFRQRDLDELAADGLLDIDGSLVALPQRRRARGRLPDAHEARAGAAPRRRRRRAAPSAARRSTTSPTTPPRPPSCWPSSARSTASARRSPTTPSRRCSRRPRAALETGRLDDAPSAPPAAGSTSTRADPKVERGAAARARRGRARAAASSPRPPPMPRRSSTPRWPPATRIDEGEARRRLGSVAQMQGDLATARRELGAAVDLFREAGDERRLANALRAAGLRRGVRRLARRRPLAARRGDGHLPPHRRRARPRVDPPEPGVGRLPGRRLRRRRGAARRGQGALRGARRRQRRDLGRRAAWPTSCTSSAGFDEAEALAVTVEARRPPLGRHVGEPDDDDAARQPAAVDRPARRGRAARRAGARRVPRDQRPLRRDAGARARSTGPAPGSARRPTPSAASRSRSALGKQFGELGMALQGAAGVAMHLGAGEQALTLAEQVIERNESTGTNQDEASVLLALAAVPGRSVRRCAGRHRAGGGRGLPVRARRRGPSCAPSPATAAGRSRTPRRSRSRAAPATSTSPSARLAGVLAAVGSATTWPSRRWLDQLGTLASSVGDVVFVAMAQLLARPPGGDGDAEPNPLAPGWRRIVDSVVVG